MRTKSIIPAVIAAALLVTPFAGTSTQASAFFAWQVTDVPYGDLLNVRKWPSNQSAKQAAYPNTTILSMTGRCKDAPTLIDQIAHLPQGQQRQAVRFKWCEIWHDPARNGQFVTGWTYMKYMQPMN